jgi:putative tryptophan/tyrosine transport system substrate-binding protein
MLLGTSPAWAHLARIHRRRFIQKRSFAAVHESAFDAVDAADLDTAFESFARENVQTVVIYNDPVLYVHRRKIAELALALRMPTIFNARDYVEVGGLSSYGVNILDNFHRVAAFVDKILKGARPADLPIEFPTRLYLVINLKTAKALGLTVPPSLLARADEVIE